MPIFFDDLPPEVRARLPQAPEEEEDRAE
jgi:hypothetical protein